MDRRQTEIVEGAGLEESRINVDLADWLKKWGSPILMIVLAVALGYRGWIYLQQQKIQALDNAFIELDAATQSGQPAALLQVAQSWKGKATVSFQADLEAADTYLLAYTVNIKPGGVSGKAEDVPSDEERQGYLEQAGTLYRKAVEGTSGNKDYVLLTIRALSGQVAVQITQGKLDEGRATLNKIISLADEVNLTGLAQATRNRLKKLASAPNPAPLRAQDEIIAYKPTPTPEPADSGFKTPEDLLKDLGKTPSDAGPPTSPMLPIGPSPDPEPSGAPASPPAGSSSEPPPHRG